MTRADDEPACEFRGEAMRALDHEIDLVAPLRDAVLLRAELGTELEGVARHLHARSPRRDGPFVSTPLETQPEHTMESVYLGALEGCFCGVAHPPGLLQQADGGTLFLDELEALPIAMQVKLLRFLKTGAFTPVGASSPRCSDVRIVAATYVDLDALVGRGVFREDLLRLITRRWINVPQRRAT